ncbi:MAG: NAD(P) transhydrogenase subunit alpha, partial [Thermoleophilaceae bacterium]|nr:NAD(P) transhydrogenase subunit alpha [Thermoleophilaceae bacterium]
MIVGVPRETSPGERRVALVPAVLPLLTKVGLEIRVEAGAGEAAGFPDAAYVDKGATLVSREEVFASDVVLQVRTAGANRDAAAADADLALMRPDQAVIGFADPLGGSAAIGGMAARGVAAFAMELMPRITRAQAMDALSSQATIAGYKAVILAAESLHKMFPKLTTAAGTLAPVRVFVVGAGVAGLQAIATARRLGAVVEAYDVRPAVKEQVLSVGAKFVELPLEAGQAEDTGGYARAMDEAFYARQREMMTRVVAANDVVITTALIPGRRAPVLITAEMVRGMAPGAVIVDLAAEQGGNCELTRPDEDVDEGGVRIIGPTNLPASVPFHASQMYARNVSAFLLHLVNDGALRVDPEDQ